VRSLTQEQADQLGITGGKGVLVTDVKPDSFADDIGVQRGYVILKVNGHPINSEEEFRKATSQLKSGQDVVFLVRTGRGQSAGNVFLSGTLP
jgi:serine protease Do